MGVGANMKVICIKHASYDDWKLYPDINEVCEVTEISSIGIYGVRIKSYEKATIYYPKYCFITLDKNRDNKLESIGI